MSWREHAACRGCDTDLWCPERGDGYGVVYPKSVCRECPVRLQCLDDAGANEGIWGGLTRKERQDWQAGRRGNDVRIPAPGRFKAKEAVA